MQILETGDRRVMGILGKKLRADRMYRLSVYTTALSEGRVHLLRSTLTGVTAAFSDDKWALAQAAHSQPVTGTELLTAGLGELAQGCIFIEEGTDEGKCYEFALSVLKFMSREKKGTKTYTVLPTTGCNARCAYCYEEGMPVRIMTEETADRVVEFIRQTRWPDEIKLVWFGGEPLAASRIISRICRKLAETDVPFRSKLVTNGTLLTPELLEEAVTVWRTESAQVSVDGKREDYEARKRFVFPAAQPYDTMMCAVGGMLGKGIRVTLRVNCDGDNLGGFREFFEDVKARFGSPENLQVYPAMLFQAKTDESCVGLYRKMRESAAYLKELGLNRTESGGKPFTMKTNYCGADAGDKCVVIDPEGLLYHCEHLPGNTAFGSIFDTDSAVRSDKRAGEAVHEACKNCPFLPECTPFYRNGCPDWFAYCREFKQIEADEALRNLLKEQFPFEYPQMGGAQ